jgi:taurine dioxygenase
MDTGPMIHVPRSAIAGYDRRRCGGVLWSNSEQGGTPMARRVPSPVEDDYRLLDIRPVAGSLGAEVFGVDLGALTDAAFDEIYRAFVAYQAIIFRDQELTTDQFLAFGRRWGDIQLYPYARGLPSHPEILEVLRTEKDPVAFGNVWHFDGSNYAAPPKATMLYALELPPAGGDTMFANMYDAFDTLSPGMKSLLQTLKGLNVGQRELSFLSDLSGMEKKDPGDMVVSTLHPVVRTHPDSGRKSLFVGHRMEHFDGMTPQESAPLIACLRNHAVRPEFTCRFSWRVGSLAIWDNRCVQHYAVDDYAGHRRRMHRITIAGEEAPT